MTAQIADATALAVARVVVESGRRARLALRGESMLPMFHEPMTIDVVALRRPARIGDILVFRVGDAYVAHRVIARRMPNGYVTAGDGNSEQVEEVSAADVLGRVDAVWSDASSGADRIDTISRRLRGTLYARARHMRMIVRAAVRSIVKRRRPNQENEHAGNV